MQFKNTCPTRAPPSTNFSTVTCHTLTHCLSARSSRELLPGTYLISLQDLRDEDRQRGREGERRETGRDRERESGPEREWPRERERERERKKKQNKTGREGNRKEGRKGGAAGDALIYCTDTVLIATASSQRKQSLGCPRKCVMDSMDTEELRCCIKVFQPRSFFREANPKKQPKY